MMTRNRTLMISLIAILALSLAGLWGLTAYMRDLPSRISQHESIILGQNRLVPGSQAALRVVVRDSADASPLAAAEIKVSLRPASGGRAVPVFEGETDGDGTAQIAFRVPEASEPQQVLVVSTRSSLGFETVERPVTLTREARILLTTDKPLYQPGQEIHIRALALNTFDLTPASGQELSVVISDGKGNKVFRQKQTTSDYGVAAFDFQLATQVNTGRYKLTASLGDATSESTVTVEHYVLPKFAIELETERDFYLPGQVVAGSLQGDYFFGKPVAGGAVLLEGYTFDVERTVHVQLHGSTDESGLYQFEFTLPDYIAGTEFEGGLGRFYIQASLTDQAQHTEMSNTSLPVAQSALVIEAIPEGGHLIPGVENILYVLTSYPDGSPAETRLEVTSYETGEQISLNTGAYGLAEARLVPNNAWQGISISARDALGNASFQEFYFEGPSFEESVLLRPDRPVYKVGESMVLSLLTSQPAGTVYLDIVRQGQTVSTRTIPVADGAAEVVVDLSPELYGTLELHAYKILSSGHIVRDTRLVVVDQADDLQLEIAPDQSVYRPGDTGTLNLQVNDRTGNGAQAAVGVAIVDESVFALAEQDPGFARLYFMLEQELLRPKYDLHGFSVPTLMSEPPIGEPGLIEAVEGAAQASLASAVPLGEVFSLEANSHEDAMSRARERQAAYFGTLSQGLAWVVLGIPALVFGLSLFAVRREGRLGLSLTITAVVVTYLALIFFAWPLGRGYEWVRAPGDRLGLFIDRVGYGGEEFVMLMGLVALLAYAWLAWTAWARKDALLGWLLILLPIFPLAVALMGFSISQAGRFDFPANEWLILGSLALAPLAFALRGVGLALGRRITAALASLVLGFALLLGAAPLLALSSRAMAPDLAMPVEEMREGAFFAMDAVGALPVFQGTPIPEPEGAAGETAGGADDTARGEPPRLRQYFPETMLWLPDAVTNPQGSMQVEVPMADSITTWRVTALASTQDGRLGSQSAPLRVFQDFFIDLDLPVALTVGDELSIPVGVFNYLPDAQSVRLEAEAGEGFVLMDEGAKEMQIAANEIGVVYFKVRAVDFGRQPFKVTAWGSQMSDAIQKEVRIYPDGKQFDFTSSDRLEPGSLVRQVVNIPEDAIPGTQSLTVKIYPGVVSQVVEGLESILRMPYGCFEQTSSTTYPNVLVLDYLRTTGQTAPEVEFQAEEFINLGYQRLTTFEVGGSGGFSLFGDPPADRMLTAYGLQEFGDMSRVHDVDPAFVRRAAEWLLNQQESNGSWKNDRGLVHENTWQNLGDERLPVSAYIVWSLIDAGFGDDPRTQLGLAFVRENQSGADDAYVLALVANALVSADLAQGDGLQPATESALERLAAMAEARGNGAVWSSGVATFMGSEGQTGSIETTALAALAFLRAERQPELANAALTALLQDKDSFGTWYSTQATVLSLKALLASVRSGAQDTDAQVTVRLNGGQNRQVQVTPENFDVVQLISFDDVNPGRENVVEIEAEGQGSLMYQVTGSYYLPWEALPLYPELAGGEDLVAIDVAYDRTALSVEDTVTVKVTVTLNEPGGVAEAALIDLGLPPGFGVQAEDLAAYVERFNDVPADYAFATIERYELTGRQILVYVQNLTGEQPLEFSYRLKALYPLSAQTPASNAYDYYNPQVSGETAPQTLIVLP